MDEPQPLSADLEVDLHNLRQLNRFFGSYSLIRFFLNRWIKADQTFRIVDLATGSGDIPRLVVEHARAVGAKVEIDAIDAQASTLEVARKLSSDSPEIRYQAGDIRTWQGSEPYDIVMCSLVLHHFSEADAVQVLANAAKLSRRYVLVADLRRSWLASYGVLALTALLYRHPMTRHDGRLSAARAFSGRELCQLARQAEWKAFRHAHFKFARQAIWLERSQAR